MLAYFFIIEYGEQEVDDPEGVALPRTPLRLNMRGELSTISAKIASQRTPKRPSS